MLLNQSSIDTDFKEKVFFVLFCSVDPRVNKKRVTTMRMLQSLLFGYSGEESIILGSRRKEIDLVDCGCFLYLQYNYFSCFFFKSFICKTLLSSFTLVKVYSTYIKKT